ncbi:MAG: hypothetical protein AAGA55_03655 [Planctomycetota bacterium]
MFDFLAPVVGGFPCLIMPLMVAAVIYAIVIGQRKARERREQLQSIAARYGLEFHPARDRQHDDFYAHFEIFRRGNSRTAFNTLIGEHAFAGHRMGVKAGDFRYTVTTGSGKDRKTTTYTFSYLIIHLPFQTTPDLLIRPEHFFDKLAGVFSSADIDFESEEFSRRFMVASPDRKFAYDVCHPRMIEFLLKTRPPAIDIEHGRLCLADGSRTWTPDQFTWMFEFAESFLSQWPEHVVKDLNRPS